MASFFRERGERLALHIVGDGDTECAFINGLKRVIREMGILPKDLEVTIKPLKTGGGNPENALDLSLRKYFSGVAPHRRILLIDSEGEKIDATVYRRAEHHRVEMKISDPCFENHLLAAYGIPCKEGLAPSQYKRILSDYFGKDFHPLDPDWHAKKITALGLEPLITRDDLTLFLHSTLTSTNHPFYTE